jgi:dolichyl-phosphate-mannose-protein mannosyltransferase
VLYIAVIGMFWLFRAFSFGMEGNHKQWSHLKWLTTWRMTD